jgi:hypothetical protein
MRYNIGAFPTVNPLAPRATAIGAGFFFRMIVGEARISGAANPIKWIAHVHFD